MRTDVDLSKKRRMERIKIFEMIEASLELAKKKGKHPLERGCCCIACVNRRKRLIEGDEKGWKFTI